MHVTAIPRAFLRLIELMLMGSMALAPAHAAQVTVQASASAVKSLSFTARQNLDFGTVMPAATGTTTVTLSMAGAIGCPPTATCTGAARPAIFNVQGSNKGTVRVTALPSNLVNSANGNTIRYTPDAPATVTITNSGAPGTDFNVAGSIASPATAEGTYVGNIEITVDYQ